MTILKYSLVLVIRVIGTGMGGVCRRQIPVVIENYGYNIIIIYDIHTFNYKLMYWR